MKTLEIRVLEGANIYTHRPVIKLRMDLEDLSETSTGELPVFVELLLECMPSLSEHHCSTGRPGGFADRLRTGTYLGHVIEHVALELQHLAGMDVIYGKTVRTEQQGVYDIIIEYKFQEAGILALRSAAQIVEKLLRQATVDIEQEVKKVKTAADKLDLGPSTGAIAREAARRGIPVLRLGEGSFLQLGYGKYQKKVEATITGQTSCVAVDIACDKLLVKHLLDEAGIPVPQGGAAGSGEEALRIAQLIGGAVAVKPVDGNQGKGVSVNLHSGREILRAVEYALSLSPKAIVERYIEGKHYRLTVVGNKVAAAAEKIPAFVVGDGHSTVRELVDLVNLDPLRGDDHDKPLTKIRIDASVVATLARNGLAADSVPAEGQVVYLRETANLSTGGVAADVTGMLHPDITNTVLRAVRLVGLDVAGVDLVLRDISKPLTYENGAIIEVNAAPGFRMHHYPAKGPARNVAGAVIDLLFPVGSRSRIPILSVTGTNGKTTVTRLVGHILKESGLVVGMTTTDGIYIDGEKILTGDATGPRSARAVLRDPTVEAAVLETARGGILRCGLGYDYSNVGIITNISNDHLGLDGVETLEDMTYVKAVVAEAVHRDGITVLNADDPNGATVANRVKSGLIYFSMASDNLLVRRHLGIGGTAVFVKQGNVLVVNGNRVQKILQVREIPCTLGGLASHNLQNVLAAVGGCVALGVELDVIRNGLVSFKPDQYCNPGRFNIFEMEKFKVIVDYGHNESGYVFALQTAKKMKPKRLIGVVGMPGDRRNEDIQAVGRTVAKYCDQVIIKEDSDPRGRKPGEVAKILRETVLEAGLAHEKAEVVLSETRAVSRGLELAREGDVLIVFFEKLDPVLGVIDETCSQRAGKTDGQFLVC